jgi:hypothetical protein
MEKHSMRLGQPSGRGTAIVVASAAILTLVTQVSPEPAVSSIPPQTAASFAAICATGSEGRPDPAWMRQSFEDDHCSLPQEPPVLDGTKASRDQLMTGLAAAKKFAASADRFQQCINSYLTLRQQEAQRAGKPVKLTLVAIETHRIIASEASKKRVRDRIAMAVDDFNAEGSGCPQ